MDIGKQIKFLRKKYGYTQAHLAELLGVKPTTVASWEQGRNKPLMDKVQKMSIIFSVPISEIVGDENGVSSKADQVHNMSIDEALGTIMSFDGKPVTDHDKKVMKGLLESYLRNKEQ